MRGFMSGMWGAKKEEEAAPVEKPKASEENNEKV